MAAHLNKADTPEYLSKKLFQSCLAKNFGISGVEVIEWKISSGSDPGDNYTSIIYRASITYKNLQSSQIQKISFIIKSNAIEAVSAELEKSGVVGKERIMYQEMLPKLQDLLDYTRIAPKLYDIIMEPHCNLIFEDMKALGYEQADREKGLDEDHMALVLRKTALFHAASMELLRKEPEIKTKYLEGMVTKESVKGPFFKTLFQLNIKQGAEMVANIPGYECFSDKLMKIYEHFEEIALTAIEETPKKDIQVLLHGDLWVNNFLFLYENHSNKPTDLVFLDFQLSFFGSLGIELNYLFATSATLELLKRRVEMIEAYYYPSFHKALQSYGFVHLPTLDDIMDQIKDREMFFIIAMFGILPLISIDREESKTSDITQFFDEERNEKKRRAGMSSQRFIETMKFSLKAYESTISEITKKY